jgi:hypothetical protein
MVVNDFRQSSESANLAVNSFYAVFLQRPADAGGSAYWTQQLENGTMTFSQVALPFLSSPEFVADARLGRGFVIRACPGGEPGLGSPAGLPLK